MALESFPSFLGLALISRIAAQTMCPLALQRSTLRPAKQFVKFDIRPRTCVPTSPPESHFLWIVSTLTNPHPRSGIVGIPPKRQPNDVEPGVNHSRFVTGCAF
ncbi:hypothetical protein AX16_000469 [Volvariella volvacea WC 439]|nr:hypothetical protein AX16_000469 [Volvariella volvacea WC 439]